MPYKNIPRYDDADAYYHIYNRGIAKMDIFLDDQDYRHFENIIVKLLSKKKTFDSFGREYKNYHGEVNLLAYCLMPNHFHLLLHQKDMGQIKEFMKSLCVSYSAYFNKKYQRKGGLYESAYKSVWIKTSEQLEHVSRYIHLNPIDFRVWDYSSYSDYAFGARSFVEASFILGMFSSVKAYLEFVDDYEDAKRANDKYFHEIGEC